MLQSASICFTGLSFSPIYVMLVLHPLQRFAPLGIWTVSYLQLSVERVCSFAKKRNEQEDLKMQIQSPDAQSGKKQKRKRFSWMIGVLVSIVLIAILAFVAVTLLVLSSQGVTQGIN